MSNDTCTWHEHFSVRSFKEYTSVQDHRLLWAPSTFARMTSMKTEQGKEKKLAHGSYWAWLFGNNLTLEKLILPRLMRQATCVGTDPSERFCYNKVNSGDENRGHKELRKPLRICPHPGPRKSASSLGHLFSLRLPARLSGVLLNVKPSKGAVGKVRNQFIRVFQRTVKWEGINQGLMKPILCAARLGFPFDTHFCFSLRIFLLNYANRRKNSRGNDVGNNFRFENGRGDMSHFSSSERLVRITYRILSPGENWNL